MTDLIVFSVSANKYAIKIENIQRIIQSVSLTDIPNANRLIDGMMSYEDSVIKILNFRKLIGLPTYEDELSILFKNLKKAHKVWIDELQHSVEHGTVFTKTTNPHECELGIWLDNFNSYDERVTTILKDLDTNHKNLHIGGGEVISQYKHDKELALDMFKTNINDIYNRTMGDLDIFVNELDKVANSLQKLLIYENNGKTFAIKVDSIEDIVHIEETDLISSDIEEKNNDFLELDGVLDLDGVLINVIKTVSLPS